MYCAFMRIVRWTTIWTRSVHYIKKIFIKTILCIWPHIIFIILLIIGVWTISFSGKKKKRFTKEKVLARLGRLTAPMGARPPLISPWSMASWWKKPCNFPVDFVNCREWRYSEFLFIYLSKKPRFQFNLTQKAGFSVNIGRLAVASALGEQTSEHAVFNIQFIF